MPESLPTANDTEHEQYPTCELCDEHAIVKSVLIINNRAEFAAPLCDEHYCHPSELGSPSHLSEAEFINKTQQAFSLITSPADEIYNDGEEILIVHGPGNESKITSP